MVKKFLNSVLGKGKTEKKEETEDVPDELPPLAEDTPSEEKTDEKKEAPPEEKSKKEDAPEGSFDDLTQKEQTAENQNVDADALESETKEETPEELPPLEEGEKAAEEKVEEKKESPSVDKDKKEDVPEKKQLNKTEDIVQETKADAPKETQQSPIIKEKEPAKVDPPKEKEIKPKDTVPADTKETEIEKGFFSEVYSLIEKQGINEEVLSQDLLRKMKDFWYFHPEHRWKFKNKDNLKEELISELSELKALESRWLTQRNFLEEDKRQLLQREREIDVKTEKMKKILKQLRFHNNVEDKQYFNFPNGIRVKNIYELMTVMEVISDDVFKHHISAARNDYSAWIEHAVGDKELAELIRPVKTRQEMAVILENALMGKLYAIDPKEYFRLNDGQIIRNIKELIGALKEMDSSLYNSHVNEIRNDFSGWVGTALKNSYLAGKIKKCETKEETIKILEDFNPI